MIHLSSCTELNMIEAKKYAALTYSSPYMTFALVVVKSTAPDSNARHLTDPVVKTVDNYLVCIGMTKKPATYSPYYEPTRYPLPEFRITTVLSFSVPSSAVTH